MIRLTLLLLAAIGVTMSVAGRDIDRPAGTDQPGGDVARMSTDIDGVGPVKEQKPKRLALSDQTGALKAALAATARAATPNAAQAAESQSEPEVVKAALETTGRVEPKPEPAPGWVVTGNHVNLREGPSTSTSVIGQAGMGEKAEMLEKSGSWYRIRTDGATGYIYGRYLEQQS